jgi:hypothetical protein
MVKSKEPPVDLFSAEIDRELLVNILSMTKNVTSDHGGTYVKVDEKGIILGTVDPASVVAWYMYISKDHKAFKKYYIWKEHQEIILDESHLQQMITFYKLFEKAEYCNLALSEDKVKMACANPPKKDDMLRAKTRRAIQREWDVAIKESVNGSVKTINKFVPQLKNLGSLDSEPFGFIVSRFSGFKKKVREDYITLIQHKKGTSLFRPLDKIDNVECDMKDIIKTGRKKHDVEIHLPMEYFNSGIKHVTKLVERMTVLAENDMPIIFTAAGGLPKEAKDFKENLDFWYCIAPRIMPED